MGPAFGHRFPGARRGLGLVLATWILWAGGARAEARTYVVSIPPLQTIVEQLAAPGDHVVSLVGPGQSPALFEPTSRQLAELSEADAVFVVGVPFERTFVPKARRQFPHLHWVDVTEGIEPLRLPALAAGELDHGDHVHTSDEPDPHVWTGPRAVRTIGANVRAALEQTDPSGSDALAARYTEFEVQWIGLDAALSERLRPLAGRSFLSFHPAFGYFAAEFGLRQLAVESGGTEPSARHLVALAERLRAERPLVLLVQPQFSPDRARGLARTLDLPVVVLDPLQRDIGAMMVELTDRLLEAAGSQGDR